MLIGLQNFKKFKNFFFYIKTNQRVEVEELRLAMTILSCKFFIIKKCKILYFQENFIRDLGFNPRLHQKLIGVLV